MYPLVYPIGSYKQNIFSCKFVCRFGSAHNKSYGYEMMDTILASGVLWNEDKAAEYLKYNENVSAEQVVVKIARISGR